MTLIKSMTGYGRAVKTLLGREFTVELRAVNNRYLDCTVKLPRSLTFAEEGVKQRVKAAVARGKVDVLISVGAAAGEPVQVSLNRPVLEGYLQAMNAMVQEYGVHNDISAAALARLPEVFWWKSPRKMRTSFSLPFCRWWTRLWLPLTPCERQRAPPWKRTCRAGDRPF